VNYGIVLCYCVVKVLDILVVIYYLKMIVFVIYGELGIASCYFEMEMGRGVTGRQPCAGARRAEVWSLEIEW
jgi:hypothetical protein